MRPPSAGPALLPESGPPRCEGGPPAPSGSADSAGRGRGERREGRAGPGRDKDGVHRGADGGELSHRMRWALWKLRRLAVTSVFTVWR